MRTETKSGNTSQAKNPAVAAMAHNTMDKIPEIMMESRMNAPIIRMIVLMSRTEKKSAISNFFDRASPSLRHLEKSVRIKSFIEKKLNKNHSRFRKMFQISYNALV